MSLIRDLLDRTSPYRSSAAVILTACLALSLGVLILVVAALCKRSVYLELGVVVTGLTTLVTTAYVKAKAAENRQQQ